MLLWLFPTQTTFGNLINIEFNLPGNYCFLVDDSEVAGVAGTEISFVFVNDDNCFRLVLPDNSCPTAGTGDGQYEFRVSNPVPRVLVLHRLLAFNFSLSQKLVFFFSLSLL